MTGAVLALRVAVALVVVVGLIWLIARRYGAAGGRRAPAGPTMRVVGRQALGRHAGVAVVEVGNRRLLLGYGEQQVSMLTELAPAPAVPAAPVASLAHPGDLPQQRGVRLPALTGLLGGGARAARAASAPGAVEVGPTLRPVPSGPLVPTAASSAVPVDGERVPDSAAGAAGATSVSAVALDPRASVGAGPAVEAAPALPAAATLRPGPLDGSVLSPATWRRAVAALQDRTVRR